MHLLCLAVTGLGSGIGSVPVHLLGSAVSAQGHCSPWDRPAPGQPLQAWPCQVEAHTPNRQGAFPPYPLSAAIPKNRPSRLAPAISKPQRSASTFTRITMVELLAAGLIGSLYLLSSNGPHGDSCGGAGLRACYFCILASQYF